MGCYGLVSVAGVLLGGFGGGFVFALIVWWLLTVCGVLHCCGFVRGVLVFNSVDLILFNLNLILVNLILSGCICVCCG